MPVQFIKNNMYWKVELEWKPPIKCIIGEKVELLPPANKSYGVYRFDRSHFNHDGPREITYIGLAFKQYIHDRVRQHHPTELKSWKKNGELWVTYAPLNLYGYHIKARYEQVEHLLTYFSKPREAKKKIYSIPDVQLDIRNYGYRGVLPKEIKYPVAFIKK